MRAPYRSAQRVTTLARNVLVSVTLEDGSTGYGESAPAQYVTGETQSIVVGAARDAAPGLVGGAVAEVLSLLGEQVHRAPGTFGALEMALLDAAARSAGLPLCRHLGAEEEAPVEAVTDLSLPLLPASDAAARAARAAAEGFRHLKIKVGGGDFADDIARVRAVAEAAPEASLRLDGNQGFSPENALTLLEKISDLLPRIALFEQPTRAGDDAALAFVSARAPVPVFADESAHTPEDARRLIGGGACRGVVLKVAKSGLSGARAIARAAEAAGGQCLFGCMMETRVAVGAALHLALALGAGERPLLLDLDGHLLVDDGACVEGGFLSRGDVLEIDPRAAGLGLVARHAPVL